ncbi:hypothetical protein EMIT043CA1_100126 [Pseudomonas brassicacearum]
MSVRGVGSQMWGGGYAGLVRNPSGKWCGIIGLGVIQIKKQGLLRSPAGASSLATKALCHKLSVTKVCCHKGSSAQGALLVCPFGWVSRIPAVSAC